MAQTTTATTIRPAPVSNSNSALNGPTIATPVEATPIPVAIPYNPPPQPAVAVVLTNQVRRGDQVFYDNTPRRVICQYCGYDIITAVDRHPGSGAHLCALGLCLLGLWPCCLIPYCVDGKFVFDIYAESICGLTMYVR